MRRQSGGQEQAGQAVSIHAPTRGATNVLGYYMHRKGVSIHAPTRGATCKGILNTIGTDVSIHAPTRGATLSIFFLNPKFSFQSTHPHGVRPDADPYRGPQNISFNPRTHTGCDGASPSTAMPGSTFQSTHPHGVRPSRSCPEWLPGQFQSTHPHGVRRSSPSTAMPGSTFQSTHPHGVRHSIFLIFRYLDSFNPRTHTGCD